MAAILVTLALLALPAPAGAEGLPVIDFVSPGGVVADQYVLNVTVIGDLAPGQVYYGVDTGDPDVQMTNTANYHWQAVIDTSGLSEGDHTVTVQAINTTGANVTRDQTIIVDHTDPMVEITSSVPDYVSDDYTVTATVTDSNVNPSGVLLVVDGNMSLSWAMVDQGGHFSHTLDTVNDIDCGPHRVAVYVIDQGGNQAWSEEVDIDVDNCPPTVMFTSYGGHVMGIYQLTVNVTDDYPDTSQVYIVFDGDRINKTNLDHQGDGVFTYSFDTTTLTDGDIEIEILATDLPGFIREAGPLVLQVDNNPPTSYITTETANVSGIVTFMAIVNDAYPNESAVYLVVDGDDDNSTMMNNVGDHYEVNLDTRMYMDGERELKVWAEDMWGMSSRSPGVYFGVDNYMPSITYLSNGGTQWGTYRVRVNITDANLVSETVMVKVGNAAPVTLRFYDDYWYHDVDTTLLPDGPVTLLVTASDSRGNDNPGEMMTITINNLADLEVVTVEWVSTDLEPGEKAKVKVGVRNNGHSTAREFTVVLTSGTKTLASQTEVTGLIPGKVHTYTLEWKAEGSGDKVVRIEVDPGNDVQESDETNNNWDQQTLSIGEGDSTPGMGAVLAVLAALGAASLARRRR
jgi:PGF-CTERM protein